MSPSLYTWVSFHKNFPIVCRPALPSDTPDIMELTRTIWDGEDYVPTVWNEWLEDYRGLLGVAEQGGRVVGTGKLTRLSAWDWWLEGLRVDPDFQGQGIASHLHDYLFGYWLKKGQGTLRLATASFRLAVQHMAERSGFTRIAEFTSYRAPGIESKCPHFDPLTLSEVGEALSFADHSQTFNLSGKLMDLGWQWTAVDESHLAEASRRQCAWWWKGRRGLLVAWEDRESRIPRQLISVAACQVGDLVVLLRDYRKLVWEAGYSEAGWSAPLNSEITPLLAQAGYTREWEDSVYVYALEHPARPFGQDTPQEHR